MPVAPAVRFTAVRIPGTKRAPRMITAPRRRSADSVVPITAPAIRRSRSLRVSGPAPRPT